MILRSYGATNFRHDANRPKQKFAEVDQLAEQKLAEVIMLGSFRYKFELA